MGSAVGDISVTVTTTGPAAALDPDGYSVAVDNGAGQAVSTNGGSATISDLTPGDHYLLIGGVAVNCTVAGGNPLKVSVAAGKTTQVAVAVACAAEGNVQIRVTTTGAWLPANGYTVSVDGQPGQKIPTNGGLITMLVTPGDHSVRLSGVAWNCAVSGPNPATVTVTVGATAQVTFQVVCLARASGGQIAFTSDRGGCPEIWAMSADGSGAAELDATFDSYCGAQANGAAWSPDGTKLAFYISRVVWWEPQGIQVMSTDGSRLSFIPDLTDPAWSPDGTRIAAAGIPVCGRGGCANAGILLMNADGSGRVDVNANFDFEPAWSPDGRIAFTRRDDIGEIFVMNADGTGLTNLTNNPATDDGPAWSPDGTKIAFRSNRRGVYDLYVMNADGSGITALTADTATEGRPAWSPDGEKIAFASDREGNFEIYVMNANGSGVVRLTNDPGLDVRPAWAH
jgi:Tol biopolymer transport system component